MMTRIVGPLMRAAAARPLRAAVSVGVLVVLFGLLALRLEPTATTETLVGKGSDSYAATADFRESFGGEAVAILVRQPLQQSVLTADLQRIIGLEGCLSGNAPEGVEPPGGPGGPCARLAESKPAKVVFGPGTFLNEAVNQIATQFTAQQQAAGERAAAAAEEAREKAREDGGSDAEVKRAGEEAEQQVGEEFTRGLLQLAVRYGLGLNSLPQIDNPDFISRIVFDEERPPGCPKARFASIFPSCDSALIQVRMRPDLAESEQREAIADIRAAVAMPEWELQGGGSYIVTGAPVVVADLTESITDAIIPLILGALLVMALTLAVVFRQRLRLLPLVVALGATALTFGALSLVGAGLTMASVAVLPILIGLGVDYAIQLHARIEEHRLAPGSGAGDIRRAVSETTARGAPTVVTAAAATAGGFLVLVLSPVPMVQGFGVLLVVGVALALMCALTLGTAVLAGAATGWSERPRTRPGRASRARRRVPRVVRDAGGILAAVGRGLLTAVRRAGALVRPAARGAADLVVPAARGAGDLVRADRLGRRATRTARGAGRRTMRAAVQQPVRIIAVGLAVAAVGWGLDTQTEVESDVQKLVPEDLPALVDLEILQEETGIGGEIDVILTGEDLTEPRTVEWMTSYQQRLLERFDAVGKPCGEVEICPAFSLPDLFRSSGGPRTEEQIDALLDAVPAYFSQGVITEDRTTANLAFGIRLMPLERQKEVVDIMRSELDPPPGVEARLAGLPVLAAEANAAVSSPWRRALTLLAGLLVVGIVLRVALGDRRRALLPLIPIAMATGWSALVLFLTRIPLNPMSVTLGALVIAISTEFSVLLSERYRQEREAGHEPPDALRRTYRSTGAAVWASGITTIAGFAVLVVSDIRMLRDFGAVTVVDLAVSLVGVLVVLPAVLVLAERHPEGALRALRGWRPARPSLPRPGLPRPRLPRPALRRRRGRGPSVAGAGE